MAQARRRASRDTYVDLLSGETCVSIMYTRDSVHTSMTPKLMSVLSMAGSGGYCPLIVRDGLRRSCNFGETAWGEAWVWIGWPQVLEGVLRITGQSGPVTPETRQERVARIVRSFDAELGRGR